MVRVIRTPTWARQYFSANSLAGWPNGVRYEPRPRLHKRRILHLKVVHERRAVTPVSLSQLGPKVFE